jgi:hypothetical protein
MESRTRRSADGAAMGSSHNPIHALLDSANVPWRLTRAELEQRYGISKHPAYDWNVINIDMPDAIADGLIYSLSVQAFPQFSPFQPATEFSSVCYFDEDERANIRRTAEHFARSLGEAPVAPRYNTLHCAWSFGAAALSLIVWPQDMQRGVTRNNPAHKRDPRLARGCHIAIRTGFRPPPTPTERSWLDSFIPISSIQVPAPVTLMSVLNGCAPQSVLEFVREPGPELAHIFGRLGSSADGAALIFCGAQLYLVRVTDIVGFRTERMQKARGPGGSHLHVECLTHYASPATKTLSICAAGGPDDLNELTRDVAAVFKKPFVLSDYFPDI